MNELKEAQLHDWASLSCQVTPKKNKCHLCELSAKNKKAILREHARVWSYRGEKFSFFRPVYPVIILKQNV